MTERRKKIFLHEGTGSTVRKYILGGGAIITAVLLFGQAFALIDKKAAEPYIYNKFVKYHDSCELHQGKINETMMYEILRISSVQKVTMTRFVKSASDSIFKEDSIKIRRAISIYRRPQ